MSFFPVAAFRVDYEDFRFLGVVQHGRNLVAVFGWLEDIDGNYSVGLCGDACCGQLAVREVVAERAP